MAGEVEAAGALVPTGGFMIAAGAASAFERQDHSVSMALIVRRDAHRLGQPPWDRT